MKGYSKVLLPCVPPAVTFSVTLVSYTSKSGGKAILGASSRDTLPRPDTVTSSEAASWALSESLLRRALRVKFPTPPPKPAGAPPGRPDTRTLYDVDVTRLRRVW